jgi:tRNA-dihydrouridine synthase
VKSFWKNLPRPFTALAPMEGVTDYVFRQIILKVGRPDVLFTEFVNVEGLNSRGFRKVAESLKFDKNELPIVVQIWGKDPKSFFVAAKMCKEMGFSGIDINLGCPDSLVVRRGSGAALIKNPQLVSQIIAETRRATDNLIPISVKIRLGFEQIDLEWIKFLLNQNLVAITIHLRTVEELSKVPAHWEVMPQIIKLRNELSPDTLIIGNGDILNFKELQDKFSRYNCDGFMIGRGIFQNPWIFNPKIDLEKVTVNKRLNLYIKHIKLFDSTWKGRNPGHLKKFCKTYVSNFPDAISLREKIMECDKITEMLAVLGKYKTEVKK